MTALIALFWFALIAVTARALIVMNRMTCLPCNSADDSAYCNPPRPHRPS